MKEVQVDRDEYDEALRTGDQWCQGCEAFMCESDDDNSEEWCPECGADMYHPEDARRHNLFTLVKSV